MSAPTKSRTLASARSEPSWREQERVLLGEVMRLVGQSLAPEVVFKEMLHLLSELLGLNRGRIVLIDGIEKLGSQTRLPPNASSSIRYSYGLTPEEAARGRYAHGEGITGTVLATGQTAVIQNIDAEPLFLARAVERARLPQEMVAYIAIPIEMNRRVIGVLGVHRIRRRKALLTDDLALLKMLATLAGQLLQLQSLIEEKTRELEARNIMLSRALESAAARYGIIGSSPPLLRALDELERVSQATASVLLLGESGTGKELFARALHMASPRRDAPFIKVNCAAIPETLFESELFGHERGAFTGAATSRAGWFEQADQGTIFLDEIGEMPLAMQTKLLRTLQEGTVVRLGGKREVPVDVRLVAATNRDLATEVERGTFRRDLFYRLNVIPIHLPSLAERRDDIRALALHFLNRNNQSNQRNVHLSTEALDVLAEQGWPGNIRELSNVIERLVLLTDQSLVTAEEVQRLLPRAVLPLPTTVTRQESDVPLVREYLQRDSHEADTLRQAMARHGGNQSRAAQSLGLTPRQFSYRWRKLQPKS